MRVIMFQPQFAEKVRDGRKPHTIRIKARCKAGDVLSLRRWIGLPYRSKQETIRTATCLCVESVSIGHGASGDALSIAGVECDTSARDALARADGFECFTDMLDWFRKTHGLPFSGELIKWSNNKSSV